MTSPPRLSRDEIFAALPGYITPGSVEPRHVGFETDWPADLSERHRSYLRNRGVGPLIAQARRYFSTDSFGELEDLLTDFEDVKWTETYDEKVGRNSWQVVGVEDTLKAKGNTAMVIPLYGINKTENAQSVQIKLDVPRTTHDEKTGKVTGKIKFDGPAGSKRGVNPGQEPADVHPLMSDDGRCPMVKTEGIPKADAGTSAAMREGIEVLFTTYNGVNKPYVRAESLDNPGIKPILSPAITESALGDHLHSRAIYLCWDADWRTNKNVRNALMATGSLLEAEGAVVMIVDVPPLAGPKTGLDDYLAHCLLDGTETPLATLLAASITLEQAEAETRQYPQDDIGRSDRFADEVLRTGSHLYCYTRKKWLAYTGTHWETAEKGSALELAKRLTERDWQDKESRTQRAINAAMTNAASRPGVTVTEPELDQDPWLLNTKTGTVDLRTGELMPHNPRDLITRVTSVGYDPRDCEENCYNAPTWDALLRLILPDRETRRWFQKAMGMAVIGKLTEDLMLKLHGPGSNGKSTVFKAFAAVLGEYAAFVPGRMLTGHEGAKPHELAAICGVRMLIMPETEQGARLHGESFKKLAGRETISAEKKFGNPFNFVPSHTLILMTNHLMSVGSADDGTWRRMVLVPFLVKIIKGQNGIADVDAKLEAEAAGILAWLIVGAKAYVAGGSILGTCDEVEKATAVYRDQQDTLGQFVKERITVNRTDPKVRVNRAQLYTSYQVWCLDMGIKGISKCSTFMQALVDANYIAPLSVSVKPSNGKVMVTGLMLNPRTAEEKTAMTNADWEH